jgi:hypothetical protein
MPYGVLLSGAAERDRRKLSPGSALASRKPFWLLNETRGLPVSPS